MAQETHLLAWGLLSEPIQPSCWPARLAAGCRLQAYLPGAICPPSLGSLTYSWTGPFNLTRVYGTDVMQLGLQRTGRGEN